MQNSWPLRHGQSPHWSNQKNSHFSQWVYNPHGKDGKAEEAALLWWVLSQIQRGGDLGHTIAVAHSEGRLSEFIMSYKLPMNCLVRSGIPGGSGKKNNKNPPRYVTQFGEQVHVTTEDAND